MKDDFEVRLGCPYQRWLRCPDDIVRLIPCGKCYVCKTKIQNSWFVRLKQEFDSCSSAYFITLTYANEHLKFDDTGFPIVCSRDIQLFIKRLRKSIQPFKIRYFLCSEYSPELLRPHYHLILFNFPKELDVYNHVNSAWKNGFIKLSSLNDNRIRYVSKYCTTITDLPECLQSRTVRPFIRCSSRPAIGSCFLDKKDLMDYYQKTEDPFVMIDGYKYFMPRYYRNKIFSVEQRKFFEQESLREREEYFSEYFSRYTINPLRQFYSDLTPTPMYQKYVDFSSKVKKKNKERNKVE